MRFRLFFILLAALAGLSACNLSGGGTSDQPIGSPTSRPNVTISAPSDGDTFAVNEEIGVSVTAADPVGITRLQLIVNGQIRQTETTNGETALSTVLAFTPTTPGDLTIQVIAYRSSVVSDPAQVEITVAVPTAAVTTTRTPQIIVPTSNFVTSNPGSTICRARTGGNVNLRPGPGTNYEPIILVIPGGVEAPIIGRLFNNTWWYVAYAGRNGWVSANVVQPLGNCSAVPIVPAPPTATPPIFVVPPTVPPSPTVTQTPTVTVTPGLPDLLVTSLSIVGTPNLTLSLEGTPVMVTFSAVITNLGAGSTGQFTNAALIMPDGTTQEIGSVGALGAGQSITQQFTLTFITPGTRTIQVQADSASQVNEVSDVNNSGQINVTIQPPLV